MTFIFKMDERGHEWGYKKIQQDTKSNALEICDQSTPFYFFITD